MNIRSILIKSAYMDFLSLVKQRQSDRAFDPERSVEPEKLERILEAGRLAPSSCNSQPWHFIVVDDPELKNRVADATSNFPHIDIGVAAAHIVLAAAAEGLGSCMLGWFDEKAMRKVLGIPSGKRVILDIVVGYSVQEHRDKKRKSADTVISANHY